MADAVKVLLECVGEDVERGGLKDTPMRVAKALQFMTKGYKESVEGLGVECVGLSLISPADVIGSAVFDEDHDDMVVVKVCCVLHHSS
jgi:GTP cyclohydrolase I